MNLKLGVVFKTTGAEALVTARRLLRGYASAPEPPRQVQQFYSALVHAEGGLAGHEPEILAFGA